MSAWLTLAVQVLAIVVGAFGVLFAILGWRAGAYDVAGINALCAVACGVVFLFMEYVRATMVP